jgi:Glycosyl transferase family 2
LQVFIRQMPSLAPIVVFAYNRPAHLRRLLESLAANELAAQSQLTVVVDGPKPGATPADLERQAQVRAVVAEQPWCGQVHLVQRPQNWGLARSLVGGITDLLAQHLSVIVLEDDLWVAPGFLAYQNQALARYAHDARVMHVSGFMYPVPGRWPETFFYRKISCWGWGTWRRAWQHFNPDAADLLRQLQARPRLLNRFNLYGAYDFARVLRLNAQGELHTWAIKWQASVYLQQGLSLSPRRSLVRNLGFDGSGEHCDADDGGHARYPVTERVAVGQSPVRPLLAAERAVGRFYIAKEGGGRRLMAKKWLRFALGCLGIRAGGWLG